MKKSKFFIDTNIFLRALMKDHTTQTQSCLSFFDVIETRTLKTYTSGIVIAELIWSLKTIYQLTKAEALYLAHAAKNTTGLVLIDKTNTSEALDIYAHNNLKYGDALIASLEFFKQKSAVLVSYDKEFNKLPLKRMQPEEILKDLQIK